MLCTAVQSLVSGRTERGLRKTIYFLQGLASTDHTTLLLNCYTKLKDVDKLDSFLKAGQDSGGQAKLQFDVDTAIKVPPYASIAMALYYHSNLTNRLTSRGLPRQATCVCYSFKPLLNKAWSTLNCSTPRARLQLKVAIHLGSMRGLTVYDAGLQVGRVFQACSGCGPGSPAFRDLHGNPG